MRYSSFILCALFGSSVLAGQIKSRLGRDLCLTIEDADSLVSDAALSGCDNSIEQQWMDNTVESYQIQSATINNKCLQVAQNQNATRFGSRTLVVGSCKLSVSPGDVKATAPAEQRFDFLDSGVIRFRGSTKVFMANTTTYCVEARPSRRSADLYVQPCVAGRISQLFDYIDSPYDGPAHARM